MTSRRTKGRVYQVGDGPSEYFVKVPNDVCDLIDDPVALAILVWAMKKPPTELVRQEDAIRRFHVVGMTSEGRVKKAWRRLLEDGYLQHIKVYPVGTNYTIRGWEPKRVKRVGAELRDREPTEKVQSPTVGERTRKVPKRCDTRQSENDQAKEKTVDQTEDSAVVLDFTPRYQCPLCKGAGHLRNKPCQRCAGVGQVAL